MRRSIVRSPFRDGAKTATLTNNNAGKGTRRAGYGAVIGGILSTPDRHYDTKSLKELEAAIAKIKSDEDDIMAFAGGDGTLQHNITRAIATYSEPPQKPLPYFCIAPTGTMNNFAKSHGVTRWDPFRFAEVVAAKVRLRENINIAYVRPLCIRGDGGAPFYGFLYGAGFPRRLLDKYYANKRRTGVIRVLQVIAGELLDEFRGAIPFCSSKSKMFAPIHAKVTYPDYDPPVGPQMTHTGILVGAIHQLGMGCNVLPEAMSQPGRFMVRTTTLTMWGLTAFSPGLWAGSQIPFTHDAVVDKVVIDYEEPTPRTIDGELIPPVKRDEITMGPLLRFIVG